MGTNEDAIDERIVRMKKEGETIFAIHKWMCGFDNFAKLDEQIVLVHIVSVIHDERMFISRKEVRKCFNKNYKKEFHGDKNGFLSWIYGRFDIEEEKEDEVSKKEVNLPMTLTQKRLKFGVFNDGLGNTKVKVKKLEKGGKNGCK